MWIRVLTSLRMMRRSSAGSFTTRATDAAAEWCHVSWQQCHPLPGRNVPQNLPRQSATFARARSVHPCWLPAVSCQGYAARRRLAGSTAQPIPGWWRDICTPRNWPREPAPPCPTARRCRCCWQCMEPSSRGSCRHQCLFHRPPGRQTCKRFKFFWFDSIWLSKNE